jgi:hypothetical protein
MTPVIFPAGVISRNVSDVRMRLSSHLERAAKVHSIDRRYSRCGLLTTRNSGVLLPVHSQRSGDVRVTHRSISYDGTIDRRCRTFQIVGTV